MMCRVGEHLFSIALDEHCLATIQRLTAAPQENSADLRDAAADRYTVHGVDYVSHGYAGELLRVMCAKCPATGIVSIVWRGSAPDGRHAPLSSPFLDAFREKLARGESLTHDEAAQLLGAHDSLMAAYHDVGVLSGDAPPSTPGSSSPHDMETLGDFWRGDVKLTDDERRWVRVALDVQEPRDAPRAKPRYNQPNNVVACVACKRPVYVSALNAIRCEQCKEPSAPRALRGTPEDP